MEHICLTIAYDGKQYNGFQTQPEKNTIQDKIEEALYRVTGEWIKINGSGRTDAGVHARAQFIDFHVGVHLPLNRWCLALNSCLPDDIVAKAAYNVPEDFHARRSAIAKTYKYTVNFGRQYDVFQKHMQYHFPRKLDFAKMKLASQLLIGEHDFTSFAASRNIRRTNIRTINEIKIHVSQRSDPTLNIVEIYITGNGFLQYMVRIIVGTLLQVGVGKKSEQDILHMLSAKNRSLAGPTAPSHGLILWNVYYPEKFGIALETDQNS